MIIPSTIRTTYSYCKKQNKRANLTDCAHNSIASKCSPFLDLMKITRVNGLLLKHNNSVNTSKKTPHHRYKYYSSDATRSEIVMDSKQEHNTDSNHGNAALQSSQQM
jgi:hypothetical protein